MTDSENDSERNADDGMRLSWPSVYLPGAPSLLGGESPPGGAAAGHAPEGPATAPAATPRPVPTPTPTPVPTPVPAKRTPVPETDRGPPTPARRSRPPAAPTEPQYVTEARQWLMETDIDAQWRRLWRPAPLETDLDAVLAGPGSVAAPPRSSTLPPPARRQLRVFLETDLDAAAPPRLQPFGLAARTCSSKETDIDLAPTPSPSPRASRTLPRTRFVRETDVDEAMGFSRRAGRPGPESSFDTVCSEGPTPPRRTPAGTLAVDSDATAVLRSSTERTFTETDLDDEPIRPPAPPCPFTYAPAAPAPMPVPPRPLRPELILRPLQPPQPPRPTDLLMPPLGLLGPPAPAPAPGSHMGSGTMSGLGSGLGLGSASALGSGTGLLGGGVFTLDPSMLDSDVDESELRRVLLNDYDPEGFGEIPWEDFELVLHDPEFCLVVPPNKRLILAEKAAERKTTAITFQDFVNV
ncbi:Major cell-surface adhesin PAc, partial [Frankliniella fusca]